LKALAFLFFIITSSGETWKIVIPEPTWSPLKVKIKSERRELLPELLSLLEFTEFYLFDFEGKSDFEITIKVEEREAIIEIEDFSGKKKTSFVCNLNDPSFSEKVADRIVEETMGIKGYFTSRLVFVSDVKRNKELFTMDIKGRKVEQLTELKKTILGVRAEAECKWISFTLLTGGHSEIYLWKEGKLERFITEPGFKTGLSLSPDGLLAVYTGLENGEPKIFLKDLRSGKSSVLIPSRAPEVSAVFSPDGRKIAYVSEKPGSPAIYVFDMEKKSSERISYRSNYCTSPTWSGDGLFLAYTCLDPTGEMNIYIYEFKNKTERRITGDARSNESPSFYPYGHFLAFTSNRTGNYEIYITDIWGKFLKKLTNSPSNEYEVVWCGERQ